MTTGLFVFIFVASLNDFKMKWKLVLIGFLVTASTALQAQVSAIGHVSAEVIESVYAGFEGETTIITGNNATIPLGVVTFQSDPAYLCSYQVSSALFNDENDYNSVRLANQTLVKLIANENGKHDLDLTTDTAELLNGKNYTCNYSVVFAYY